MADETSKVLILAPYFRHWKDLRLESPLGVEVGLRTPDGCPGCCLVFDSFEALQEVYPEADLSLVKTFRVPWEEEEK
jgi:hypothetical protein